jgi:hypothetical protein
MKKMILILLTGVFVFTITSLNAFAIDVMMYTSASSTQDTSGIYDTFSVPNTYISTHCAIQIINAGANGTFDAPTAQRGVTVDDTIIATGEIKYPAINPSGGRFQITKVPVSVGQVLYIRAWNGATTSESTAYGNSSVFTVPSGLSGVGDFYDVGPGGGWNIYGTNNIAFYVNTPIPASDGPTGFVGVAEGTTGIRWTWNSLAGAVSYEVCDSTGALKVISVGTSTLESGLTTGNRSYIRKVRARRSDGQLTYFSTPYTAYTIASTPQAVTARGGWSGSSGYFYVTVTWESGNAAGTNYYLHRVGQSDLAANTSLIGTEESSALTGNTVCTYEVKAANGNGINSAYSNRVTTKTPPNAPTLNTSNVTSREITWSWSTPAGADLFNFYFDGGSHLSGVTDTVATTDGLSACQSHEGKVRAINSIYGEGAAATVVKWTLPSTPTIEGTFTVYPRSVRVDYSTDVNQTPVYEISLSTTQVGGYTVKEPGTTLKNPTIVCDDADYPYWFRVRAKNGEGLWSDYSNPASGTSGSGGSGGGTAVTISTVKFNNRRYIQGDVIPAKPIITAVITGDVDTNANNRVVAFDYGTATELRLPVSDVTVASAPGLPPGAVLLTATCTQSISASPVNAHKITIILQNTLGNQTTWSGDVTVMSGTVQVVGQVYNYPNPFKPMSRDPSSNSTRIAYSLNVDAPVSVMIYDITGQEMYRTSYNRGEEGGRAGVNQITWDGRSIFNQPVGNGMYVYKIISGNRVIGSGKLVVLD